MPAVESVLAAGGGFAWLAFHPLPDLCGLRRIREDDDVLVRGAGDFALNTAAGGVVGQRLPGGRSRAMVSNEAAFFRDGIERKIAPGGVEMERGLVIVPSKFLREQSGEVGLLDTGFRGGFFEGHGKGVGEL